jgi:anti-sigma factor RsiW
MSGFQELLVILLIVFAIIFMPRMIPRKPARRVGPNGRRSALSGRMRLGVALSVFYLAGAAAWLAPWSKDPLPFLYAGVGPVFAGWLCYWVVAGFRRR